ncbi:MAG: GPW/gp25 family protein [Bacteroidetes bacterium]|nr:GPW/gp25 family protein [Bacteroidota bacterium]
MIEDFLGKGWKFPVHVNKAGKIEMSAYENDIEEAIWIILSTAKGERAMRPDFGCGIFDYIFASMNTSTITMMEASVREALVLWEPRIDISNVDVAPDSEEEGKLHISIDYRVKNTNNRFNLVFPFYMKEGL